MLATLTCRCRYGVGCSFDDNMFALPLFPCFKDRCFSSVSQQVEARKLLTQEIKELKVGSDYWNNTYTMHHQNMQTERSLNFGIREEWSIHWRFEQRCQYHIKICFTLICIAKKKTKCSCTKKFLFENQDRTFY